MTTNTGNGDSEMNKPGLDAYRHCAAQGMSQAECARCLGVSREAVRRMANRYGISFRKAAPKDLKPVRAAVSAAMAAHGATVTDACEVLCSSPATVRNLAKDSGFEIAPGPWKPKSAPAMDALAEKVRGLAADGMTVNQVAEALKVHQSYVSLVKARYGIAFLRDGRRAPAKSREAV